MEFLVAEMILRADEETRTPDILHGKQVLYQLSYIRICLAASEITLIFVFMTWPQGALRGLLLCFNTEATDSRYQECVPILERVGGIEPPSSAWKAVVMTIIRHPLCSMPLSGTGDS